MFQAANAGRKVEKLKISSLSPQDDGGSGPGIRKGIGVESVWDDEVGFSKAEYELQLGHLGEIYGQLKFREVL